MSGMFVGEMEITNDVHLAPNSVLRPGLVEFDGDLTVRVHNFYFDLGGSKGFFQGAVAQALTDNTTNYLFLDAGQTLVINTTGYPVGTHIRLARIVTSGGVGLRIILERAFLSTSAAIATGVTFNATCTAGESVGDAVYISANNTVTTTDIDDASSLKSVSVGVIISKPTATTCIVQQGGTISGVYGGLTAGDHLFVQPSGQLANAAPGAPVSGTRIIQRMAYALSATEILVDPGHPTRIIA